MSRDRAARITHLIAEALEHSEYEVVDVELGGQARRTVIRVFIDKDSGITHGDCARASRLIGDRLDAGLEIGMGSYVLEVSSPGIDRPLKRAADFRRFLGETAAVTSRLKIQGRSHHLGIIREVSDDLVILEQPDLGRTEIPLAEVQKAHLRRDPWQQPEGGGGRDH